MQCMSIEIRSIIARAIRGFPHFMFDILSASSSSINSVILFKCYHRHNFRVFMFVPQLSVKYSSDVVSLDERCRMLFSSGRGVTL